MKIHLKSGKSFTCEDVSYTETNQFSGELIHIFISLSDRVKYTVKDEDIEFFESELDDEDIEELASYGECDDEHGCIDSSFG
jgi:hypothetical protein